MVCGTWQVFPLLESGTQIPKLTPTVNGRLLTDNGSRLQEKVTVQMQLIELKQTAVVVFDEKV